MEKDIRIVIMPYRWNVVGEYEKRDGYIVVHNARVIRRWGTTRGIGELAVDGPTGSTILEDAAYTEIPLHSVVMTIKCDPDKWKK